MAAKATPAFSNDPDGLLRLDRSRAQTQKGFKRLANAITRDAIGIPLTRRQHPEIRRERRFKLEYHGYGGGVPRRDLAIGYARLFGAAVVIYATTTDTDLYGPFGLKYEHSAWFYAKQDGTEVRLAVPNIAAIPSNAAAGVAMNRLQDALGKPHIKGSVWYDAATDTYN